MRTLSLCVATVLFPLATASSGGTAVSEPPEIVISHPAPDFAGVR